MQAASRTPQAASPTPHSAPRTPQGAFDLDDMGLSASSATRPDDILPDAALRRRIERLLAETPTPPDSWIDRELEAHYGELSPGEQIACRRQCRHYLAAVIGRDQIVNRSMGRAR